MSKLTRAEVIAVARREFLGVRYAPQGRTREIGYDCGGFLTVLGQVIGATDFDVLGYSPNPNGEDFERVLNEHLDPIPDWKDAKLADILACDFGDGIQHVMLVVGIHPTRRDWQQFRVMHATIKNGVNESPIPLLYYSAITQAFSMGRYVAD